MNQKQVRLMVILISGVIFLSSQTQANIFFPLQAIGYTSGYEGVKASFVAIEHEWDTESFQTDLLQGTSFYFDPDEPHAKAPNLVGEMTNAFVPEQSVPSWIPIDWFTKAQNYIKNPVDTDTWELENPDNPNEIIAYEVQEWILRMYVSITCEWDKHPFDWGAWNRGEYEVQNQRYKNTKVWIELLINQPSWIFEGQPTPYFAIGKVVCSDFAYGKLGTTEEDYTPTPWVSVTPESNSWLYLYYQKYGAGPQVAEVDPFSYRGRILNPELFTDKVYCSVNLNNFGTEYWSEFMNSLEKGDAVTWGFDVHVFVVGEWKVQDMDELPVNYGRDPKIVYVESWVTRMVSDPSFQLWSFIGLIALVVLVLAVFAPWVLFALVGLLKSGRK